MIATEQFDCLPVEEVSSMLGSIQMKEYPIFDVQKGVLTKKKVKYHNYDDEEMEVKFECEQSQYCTVNDKVVKIPPKGLDFQELGYWFQAIVRNTKYHQQSMHTITKQD